MSTTTRSTATPAQNDLLLAAGAYLPASAKLTQAERADRVDARVFRHPALGDRCVVRLTPEALAAGEEVVLGFLGFDVKKPVVVPSVAVRKRQSLGFPAWALVHDPKRARFALEVMKDFRKEARRAKSKPGFAKEGIDAIAKKLARSVPHFLPSYYEEAGRVFIDCGNQTYAAQCFGKARDAEQVHGLKIEEEVRKAAFLEFALAGAVTIKALTAYAKDLEAAHGAAEAYKHFREIAVRRTLGGLPPWASMAKDMQRLVKGAKLDADAEDEKLLEELLPASSMNRAPEGFWEAYSAALARLVKRSGAAREQLLALAPKPSGGGRDEKVEFFASWLKLVEEAGAISGWVEQAEGCAVEEPRGKAAAWFARMLDLGAAERWPTAAPDSLFALLRRMAVTLKADGTPVRVHLTNEWDEESAELELDLCDLALELGVPVADPPKGLSIDLGDWARAANNSSERPRDPLHVARDPRYGERLQKAVGDYCGREDFEKAARGKTALAEARRRWLLELCEPSEGALPALAAKLERIKDATSVATFAEFPEALPRLKALADGLEARLARSLQAGGVAAELVWPALEAACKALDPDGKAELKFCGAFPYLAVTDEKKAIVLGPKGKLLEHDCRIPKGGELRWLLYVDGQLLVVFRDKSWDQKAYWSGSPKQVFEPELEGWPSLEPEGVMVPLPGGGVHLGGGVVRVGDTKVPRVQTSGLYCDGKTWWRRVERGEQTVLEELDPVTGEKGRQSLPRFLEEFVKDGYELSLGDAELLPAPEGLKASPLGLKDGLLGWRERMPKLPDDSEENAAERNEAEAIDGRRYVGMLGANERTADALLTLPGDERPRPLDMDGWVNDDLDDFELAIWDADGKFQGARWGKKKDSGAYAEGVPVVLPHQWLHLYEPRDPQGSAALRKLDEAVARELLEAARADLEAKREDEKEEPEPKKTEAALKKLLPEIKDKNLRRGVAGVALAAAQLGKEQQELAAGRDPENPEAIAVAADQGDSLDEMRQLCNLLISGNSYDTDHVRAQLRSLAGFFTAGAPTKTPECDFDWAELMGKVGALVYLAAAPGTEAKARDAALTFLEAWIETPFLVPEAGKWRYCECEVKQKKIPFPVQGEDWDCWAVGELSGSRYFITGLSKDDDDEQSVHVLEHAPEGKLKLLPGAKLSEEKKPAPGWATPEKLRAFVDAIRVRGAWTYERAQGEALAARTGLSYPEAALLVAGCPHFNEYNKNFLPTELRETLGLKVNEADAAKDALRALGEEKLRRILDGALPDDPEQLYVPLGAGADDDASFIAKLGESVTEVLGKRIALDPNLVAQIGRDLNFLYGRPAEMIATLSDPKRAEGLNKDGTWYLDDWGVSRSDKAGGEVFDEDTLFKTTCYFLYLATELPAGHPLRGQLPEVHSRVVKRLSASGLVLGAGNYSTGNKKKNLAFLEGLGGKSYKPPKSDRKGDLLGRDAGALLALPDEDDGMLNVGFRPGKMKAKDWELLRKLECDDEGAVGAAEIALSEGAKQIAARLKQSPVPEGSYEANPLHSAPEVVAAVRKKLKLEEDAAVLYLQLLALAAPTDARIRLWNGWTPSRISKAAEVLKKAKLVVQAKRARAGRSYFLPGGWEALSAPNLPIETWKLPLYGAERAKKTEKVKTRLPRLLPLRPLHELFAEAWKRTQSGDAPAYQQVK